MAPRTAVALSAVTPTWGSTRHYSGIGLRGSSLSGTADPSNLTASNAGRFEGAAGLQPSCQLPVCRRIQTESEQAGSKIRRRG